MGTKHTPGPWVWIDEGRRLNSASGLIIDSAAYEGMWFARYDKEEDEANKRLMEAAPELLEALRALLSVAPASAPAAGLLVGIEEKHSAAIKAARAAIAKATTEAP